MNKIISIVFVVVILVIVLALSGAFYIVDEINQVVVTQFGKPIGEPIIKAGLYFKIPFIQVANYFDKRILTWDGDPNQIPTRDKRYIWVDATARWRIVDPLKFMQSVGSETAAYGRLDDVVDAAARDTISNLNLVEAVRNTNRLLDLEEALDAQLAIQSDATAFERITVGREKLTRDILARASQIVPQYGIELIDVRIKRINYVKDVQKKAYERMISERKRAAEQYRSEGQGKKAEIEGQMTKELQEIRSAAYRTAQEVKGKADAEAINIYADAYNEDPEFYSFLKTLETYHSTINSSTTLILTTDSDYYQMLENIQPSK